MIHNGGWYNKEGEKLGWGDLAPADFLRISNELEHDEFFIILYESDAFWKFVITPGVIGGMSTVKPDIEAPGIKFVMEKCSYIIVKSRIYYINQDGTLKDAEFQRDGLRFTVLTPEAARLLIVS